MKKSTPDLFTKAIADEVYANTLDAICLEFGKNPHVQGDRTIVIPYRGEDIRNVVDGLHEEVKAMWKMSLKRIGFERVGSHNGRAILPLFCETDLTPVPENMSATKMEDRILGEANTARAAANGALSQPKHRSGEAIQEC